MNLTNLQGVTNTIVQRARRCGYVLQRDIRAELKGAGLPDDQWKDIVELARPSLYYRQGRYYFVDAVSPRLREELSQRERIQRTVRQLIRRHKQSAGRIERRGQDRIDFIQPVKVQTEDRREHALLSRDLSTSGIRLIGTRSLLGQKVRVLLPQEDRVEPCVFLVRVVWTCAIGDELFENGGTFLEVVSADSVLLKVVGAKG
jgi:hypothetical protein